MLKHTHKPNTGIIFTHFGGEGQQLHLGSILLNLMFKFCSLWACICWRTGSHLGISIRLNISSYGTKRVDSPFVQNYELIVLGDRRQIVSNKQDSKRSHWQFNANQAFVLSFEPICWYNYDNIWDYFILPCAWWIPIQVDENNIFLLRHLLRYQNILLEKRKKNMF